MSDSDETLPPSDTERRTCYSPDLFDDDIANPENKICRHFQHFTFVMKYAYIVYRNTV